MTEMTPQALIATGVLIVVMYLALDVVLFRKRSS